MTAQLSRERLEEIKEFGLARIIKPISDDEVLALVNIALAGMDSEPVAYFYPGDETEWQGVALAEELDDEQKARCIPLYAAPPAPVAVPDDAALRILFEKWFAADCAFDESPSATEEDNLAWKESYWRVWCACRAAMLKAGPVTGWIKCSERMPEHANTVITSNGIDIGHAWWDGDRWFEDDPVAEGITHWMPLPAAPEQDV